MEEEAEVLNQDMSVNMLSRRDIWESSQAVTLPWSYPELSQHL